MDKDVGNNMELYSLFYDLPFSRVLSKMIGLNDLGKSYDDLFGLEMITIDNLLKWFGQYPKSI